MCVGNVKKINYENIEYVFMCKNRIVGMKEKNNKCMHTAKAAHRLSISMESSLRSPSGKSDDIFNTSEECFNFFFLSKLNVSYFIMKIDK